MAKLISSTSEYVLLSVAACIIATSVLAVHAKTCKKDVFDLTTKVYTDEEYFYRGLQYSVSYSDIGIY